MLLYLVIKHTEICLKHIRTWDRSQLATFSGNVDRCTELNKVQSFSSVHFTIEIIVIFV